MFEFSELAIVAATVTRVRNALPDSELEIIVVDDGSGDDHRDGGLGGHGERGRVWGKEG